MSLLTRLLALRRDPRLLRLPPFLSGLLILVGIAWLFLLPLDEYSRNTYISENALLPGQVHTYFTGSEHNLFRAYRQEVATLLDHSLDARSQRLEDILTSSGLKAATQWYRYERAGQVREGANVYAVLQGPRADATEAIVLIAAWRNMDNAINYSGVALVLSLARYFKRFSLWSKDIIIIIPSDSTFGPQAWVDAYHDTHDPRTAASLTIKSGALQGAVAIDYPAGPWGQRFEKLHVVYDGVNGQLPNLDLINTAVSVANGQMGVACTLQRMWQHSDSYQDRLETMLRGMAHQAIGHSTGPHSSFMPYHIDAITLQTTGDGWHDEMTLGRSVEGIFRSLNNLLEHLHQSFFFYLLMAPKRFVSIGTYLPSAMLVAGNFTITSILLWALSGHPSTKTSPLKPEKKQPDGKMAVVKEGDSIAVVPAQDLAVAERQMFLPLVLVLGLHVLGFVPLYLSTQVAEKPSMLFYQTFTTLTVALPFVLASVLVVAFQPTRQELILLQCLSLLVFGAALSTLATVNFSQALFIGLIGSPLSFVRPLSLPSKWPWLVRMFINLITLVILVATSPTVALFIGNLVLKQSFTEWLNAAAWAAQVSQVWTGVMIWVVWWPAWMCGSIAATSGLIGGA